MRLRQLAPRSSLHQPRQPGPRRLRRGTGLQPVPTLIPAASSGRSTYHRHAASAELTVEAVAALEAGRESSERVDQRVVRRRTFQDTALEREGPPERAGASPPRQRGGRLGSPPDRSHAETNSARRASSPATGKTAVVLEEPAPSS